MICTIGAAHQASGSVAPQTSSSPSGAPPGNPQPTPSRSATASAPEATPCSPHSHHGTSPVPPPATMVVAASKKALLFALGKSPSEWCCAAPRTGPNLCRSTAGFVCRARRLQRRMWVLVRTTGPRRRARNVVRLLASNNIGIELISYMAILRLSVEWWGEGLTLGLTWWGLHWAYIGGIRRA